MVRKRKLSKAIVDARVKQMQRLVSKNLRYLMRTRDVRCQEELSLISGVGQSTISRYLSEKQVPAWGELVKLAHVLGTTVPTLISRDLGADEEDCKHAGVQEGGGRRAGAKRERIRRTAAWPIEVGERRQGDARA